jgi:hypothetical protein
MAMELELLFYREPSVIKHSVSTTQRRTSISAMCSRSSSFSHLLNNGPVKSSSREKAWMLYARSSRAAPKKASVRGNALVSRSGSSKQSSKLFLDLLQPLMPSFMKQLFW